MKLIKAHLVVDLAIMLGIWPAYRSTIESNYHIPTFSTFNKSNYYLPILLTYSTKYYTLTKYKVLKFLAYFSMY